MALEEALSAQDGLMDSDKVAEQITNAEDHPDGFMETASSYVDPENGPQDLVRLTSPF